MSKVDRDCLRVLRVSASRCSMTLSAIVIDSHAWASALFLGQRLTIAVRAGDDAQLDEWLIALPEAELTWPGHFVASAEVIGRSAGAATIELLVVEA